MCSKILLEFTSGCNPDPTTTTTKKADVSTSMKFTSKKTKTKKHTFNVVQRDMALASAEGCRGSDVFHQNKICSASFTLTPLIIVPTL